ncbi:MAG: purine-nucleoside phosphorylase [Verrucomicrobiota bacterium]
MPDPTQPEKTAERIRKSSVLRPKLAMVLGSGFQGAMGHLEISAVLPYKRLPGFVATGVEGHEGRLFVGTLAGCPVIILSGRAHYYEGHSMDTITFPMRVLAALGIEAVLLTNAAGAINRRFCPGQFMAFADHLNFMGDNPLRGWRGNGEDRFVDLSRAYDAKLSALLERAAKQARVKLWKGVYVAVSGPCYETPAEIRVFARLGADAVGMSTVPEAIVARQCGMAVAAVSCLTNPAAGLSARPLSHEEVLRMGRRASLAAAGLLHHFANQFGKTVHFRDKQC